MASYIVSTAESSSLTNFNLTAGDDLTVTANGAVCASDAIAIRAAGSSSRVSVLGSVVGAKGGILLGYEPETDHSNAVYIGETGYVSGSFSTTTGAVNIWSYGSQLTNEGTIQNTSADAMGVVMAGYSLTATTSKIFNSGLIEATSTAILFEGTEKFYLENSGTIRSDDYAIFCYYNTGQAEIVNTGTITGIVQLGSGNDIFDTRQGKLSGPVNGYDGNDIMYGSGGNDTFGGEAGKDVLYGFAGDDSLYGGNDDDYVDGGIGADVLFGDAGVDRLLGGLDNDKIYGGQGNDLIYGGAGNDILSGDTENDRIYGDAGDDRISGGAGIDVLFGGAGNDIINGNADNDVVNGDAGADKIYGDIGNDALNGGAGNDLVSGGVGNDKLYGGTDSDQLYGGAGNDILFGGAGNDKFFGDAGKDRIYGDKGNDLINGGAGNDLIYGGAGSDKLYGGTGDDKLYGGAGKDKLYGGVGSDDFIFNLKDSGKTNVSADIIYEFTSGDDIDLSRIDANTAVRGNQAFAFIGNEDFHGRAGELRFEKLKGDTFVYGDTNGDGKTDFALHLDDAMNLARSHFIL